MKYVYLIQSTDNGYYKIGISKNPQKRIKQLMTGNSSPLKLIESYESEFANKIERVLHRRYSHLNKEGEWFELSILDEIQFIDSCKNIEANFKFLIDEGNIFLD